VSGSWWAKGVRKRPCLITMCVWGLRQRCRPQQSSPRPVDDNSLRPASVFLHRFDSEVMKGFLKTGWKNYK
jgi:hypothetical protein